MSGLKLTKEVFMFGAGEGVRTVKGGLGHEVNWSGAVLGYTKFPNGATEPTSPPSGTYSLRGRTPELIMRGQTEGTNSLRVRTQSASHNTFRTSGHGVITVLSALLFAAAAWELRFLSLAQPAFAGFGLGATGTQEIY